MADRVKAVAERVTSSRGFELADVEIGRIAVALMREHELITRATELLERIGNVKAVP